MKTSKIKEVKRVSEPYGKFNTLYHHLVMENGDKIDIGKNKKQEVGMELTYEITGDVGQHPFTKAKSVNPNWQNNNNNFKDNSNRQESIIRQSTLKCAVEYLKGAEASLEEVFDAAEQMIAWVNKKEINTSVPKIFENIQKDIDDLPF
tara:strand:- start:616 stop:1059 length:444 start_codon:yes stop_codon:yes gene_type:complete